MVKPWIKQMEADSQQLSQADSDFFDIDERGEQALRNSCWDGKTERKLLNQEQDSLGSEFV